MSGNTATGRFARGASLFYREPPYDPHFTTLTSSIFVGGDRDGDLGQITDGGHDFTDSPGCPGSPIVNGVDIEAALAGNGGPTLTHALL